MDFTDLNKAYPKDAHSLPSIDKLVDGASEAKFLSFMDAYSVYNYIRMYPLDEKKMTFITKKCKLLLYGHALWIKEHWIYLSTIDE